jgi:GAF domain-containing protein
MTKVLILYYSAYGHMERMAQYGMDQGLIEALTQGRIGLDDPNIAQALAQLKPVQIADLREEASNEINEITLRAGYLARLVAPLRRGENVVGFLVVRRRAPGAFPQNTVDLIKTFAAQSAVNRECAFVQKRGDLVGGFADYAGSSRPNTEACFARSTDCWDSSRD